MGEKKKKRNILGYNENIEKVKGKGILILL